VLWHCWLGGRKGIWPVKKWGHGGGGHWLVWMQWRRLVVSASVNLPLHHKVQKFSSGTGSPGWSRRKGRKMVVVWYCMWQLYTIICTHTWAVFTVDSCFRLTLCQRIWINCNTFVEQCPHPWSLKLLLMNRQINIQLPSVLWHCWLGIRTSIRPVKNWVMRYWHGNLFGARCKWFAYDLADATATPLSLASFKCRMVYIAGAVLLRLCWKEGH